MKKLISVLIAFCLLSSMFTVFAVSTSAEEPLYISALEFAGSDDSVTTVKYLRNDGYTVHTYRVNKKYKPYYTYRDFNIGNAGYYLYLGYKTTTDTSLAIRDMIVMKGSEWGDKKEWLNTANGCYYEAVGGINQGTSVEIFNINMDFENDEEMYLFVTYDAKAGNPIYNLSSSNSSAVTSPNHILYGYDGKYSNLNSAALGNNVYLFYEQQCYFSSLQLGSADDDDVAEANACINGYRLFYPVTDLNHVAGGDYIYLSYQITGDASSAIRDVICLDGKYDGVNEYYNAKNGCTYTAVKGYIEEDTNTLKTVDLNRRAGGDDLWLFYTTDPKAGDPITSISFLDYVTGGMSDEYSKLAVTSPDGEIMDLNKNAGGRYIYMLCEHTKLSNVGSIFSESTIPLVIIVGGAVIAAGGMVVFLIKRKKQAVTC